MKSHCITALYATRSGRRVCADISGSVLTIEPEVEIDPDASGPEKGDIHEI